MDLLWIATHLGRVVGHPQSTWLDMHGYSDIFDCAGSTTSNLNVVEGKVGSGYCCNQCSIANISYPSNLFEIVLKSYLNLRAIIVKELITMCAKRTLQIGPISDQTLRLDP